MKQKNTEINKLLTLLESCENAISEHKNLNLAEVWIREYLNEIPKKISDTKSAESIYRAIQNKDKELLLAAVNVEMERLKMEKIKLLREKIVK